MTKIEKHAVRTWKAAAGTRRAGQLGDKKKSLQKPEDVCLVCSRRRDDAEVHDQ